MKEYAEANRLSQKRAAQKAGPSEASPAAAATAAPASDGEGESITNNQTAGVDEGGIVKVHGDHLVILRRGRLFTVRVGDASLTPIAAVDAFGPDTSPQGAWYDEMLVHKDQIGKMMTVPEVRGHSAIVIESEGFAGANVRAVLGALILLSRPSRLRRSSRRAPTPPATSSRTPPAAGRATRCSPPPSGCTDGMRASSIPPG